MRYRLAQVIVLATACLLAGKERVNAQAHAADIRANEPCPPSSASIDELPSGHAISFVNVSFSGFLRMAISDQDKLASAITQQTYRDVSPDNAAEEALERAKSAWQDHGYFKAQVNGYATTLASTSASQRLALSIHVDEGLQYRLGKITFKTNKAISGFADLRAVFPIKEGDIFSREKIATGLENLRNAYGQMGYINFTSIPDTKFDDEKKSIDLNIDINEGKEFRVGDIEIIGLSDVAREEVLKKIPIESGQIFDSGMRKVALGLTRCGCGDNPAVMPHEGKGLINLTFDFRPCASRK